MSEQKAASASWIEAFAVKGYELIEPMGDGEPGRKVKAKHVGLKRLVAMRLLPADADPMAVEKLRSRAKVLSALHHPNVVATLDAGTCPDSGVHFLATEFLEGPSLSSYLEEQGELPEPEAIAVCQAVCEALVCLEEAGLGHGDLRPGNVVLDADWTPKVSDVEHAGSPNEQSTLERWRCMAPEQIDGGGDIRADLYGLGIILYRALTGSYPYSGESFDELKAQHQAGEFPHDEIVSDDVNKVLKGLCAKKADRRYENAQQANLDLVRVMTGHPPEGVAGLRSDTESFRLAQAMGGKTETNLPPLMASPPLMDARDTDVQRVANFEIHVRLSSRGVTLSEYSFNKGVIGIGRSSSSDIHIDNPIVSRRHAEIRRKADGVFIKARSSTNVTSLNGKSVKGEARLKPGDLVVVSDKFHLELSWDPSAPARLTPTADEMDDKTPVVGTRIQPQETDEAPTGTVQAVNDDTPPRGNQQQLTDTAPEPYAENPYAEAIENPYADAVENPYDTPRSDAMTRPAVARPESVTREPPTTEKGLHHEPSEAPLSESAVRRIVAPPQGYLVYERRGRSVRSFVDKGFQVGSSHVCDLRLTRGDPRKAALIVRGVDAYRLYNVSPEISMVTLNGEPVPDRAVLEDGDEIGVCGAKLLFSWDEGGQS